MIWEWGGVKVEDITYCMAQLSGKYDVVCRESFPSTEYHSWLLEECKYLSSGSALKY